MKDKETEMLWESNTTLPNTTRQDNQMKFIELKVIQATPLVEDQIEYTYDIQNSERLGIDRPALPDSLKPVIGTRNFNLNHFTILSWSAIWDDQFDCEMIVADILWSTGLVETINAPYSAKDWKQIIKGIQ